ncbi:phage tail protein [Pseudogulbenkiania ferrooxidans]|uniref:Phage tail collar domain-containing protein n=1 Tax=Pseudogulbenkiania ferrooxidans EGD-HP2 TaxID=1388764 RepID=A0ABP2XMD0_9NEIS|nr:phage tail protein [Pseudogulbenkiania ferrooxidans]ERE07216.1 hypothetical protein O166_06605 [Pseudogulbenkiania ferrooxidans EGD-HP2]
MGILSESPSWSAGVRHFEANAVLTGGPDCPDNLPLQDLANRTGWLKKQIDDLVSGALVAEYADRLKTPRNFAMTGDGSWNVTFDGSGNVTGVLALASTGVAPGSYGVVTVDVKGRVTAARQMNGGDVPGHDWSKITSGKPTSLAGYGITDGASAAQLAAAMQYALGISVDVVSDLNSISMSGSAVYGDKTANRPSPFGVVITVSNQINIPAGGTSSSCWVFQQAFTTDGAVLRRGRINAGNWSAWIPMADAGLSGVAAGTYGIVTVDDRGRVTAARQMGGGDVPAHDWSKITSGKPTSLAGYGIADGATVVQVSAAAPPGVVAHFAMPNPPSGWLVANGSAVSRAVYAALFAAIGTSYGAGDGSSTFNLPDLRGEFVRGWDAGRGVDSGRGFGTLQYDAFQGHRHNVNQVWTTGAGVTFPSPGVNSAGQATIDATDGTVAGVSGAPRVASETRPRNIALLACIKF